MSSVQNYLFSLFVISVLTESMLSGSLSSRIADAGDGLQIWKVASLMLNRQSRTTYRGRSFSLDVFLGANILSP